MTITKNSVCFQDFNIEPNFLKNEILFQKIGVQFLVESTKTDITPFRYKIALSVAKVRQIKWGAQNGTITKKGVLPLTTLFFSKYPISS